MIGLVAAFALQAAVDDRQGRIDAAQRTLERSAFWMGQCERFNPNPDLHEVLPDELMNDFHRGERDPKAAERTREECDVLIAGSVGLVQEAITRVRRAPATAAEIEALNERLREFEADGE